MAPIHSSARCHMRYSQITVTGLTAAALFLGCEDSTTSRQAKQLGITDPAMTMAVGFTSTVLARGNAGGFHVNSKVGDYNVEINAQDNTDFVVANISVVPGGTSGWHSHPGPVLVVVKTGTITFYRARAHGDGNDGICSRTVYPTGSAFIEMGGQVANARNEGAVDATVYATYFVPAGAPTRIDQPAPGGNCPA